jgi:hypothetical protein
MTKRLKRRRGNGCNNNQKTSMLQVPTHWWSNGTGVSMLMDIFFPGSNITFYVLYPFVIYLPTLPRTISLQSSSKLEYIFLFFLSTISKLPFPRLNPKYSVQLPQENLISLSKADKKIGQTVKTTVVNISSDRKWHSINPPPIKNGFVGLSFATCWTYLSSYLGSLRPRHSSCG